MTVRKAILRRIQKAARKCAFTPADFADLGTPHAVGMALNRLVRTGRLRRVARGLYDVPRYHPELGILAPDLDAIARALAARYRIKLQPTGAYAANLLGLSDQVPMRVAYLTDGTPRTLVVGNLRIFLRRTTPRHMATAGSASGLVIQALRWLGKRSVDERSVTQLTKRLREDDKRRLFDDARYAPEWIARIMRQIARTAGTQK